MRSTRSTAPTDERLARCPVEQVDHGELHTEIWRVAQDLGWAKTYDAEYVALARLLSCRLITLDGSFAAASIASGSFSAG